MSRYQCFRGADEIVCWRLLAGNNRAVGLGAPNHADLASALEEIKLVRTFLRRAAPDDSGFVVERNAGGRWRWLLTVNSGTGGVARSAQGFARRVDVLLAVQRFHRSAIEAEVEPGLAVFETGRRGRIVASPSMSGVCRGAMRLPATR